jgi:hypothetical protein
VRPLAILFSLSVIFVAAGAARADLGLTITTLSVHSGGILRGYGNASGMPVYIVPESRAPRPFRCRGGTAYCTPHSWRTPSKPYVLLGYCGARIRRICASGSPSVFRACRPVGIRWCSGASRAGGR